MNNILGHLLNSLRGTGVKNVLYSANTDSVEFICREAFDANKHYKITVPMETLIKLNFNPHEILMLIRNPKMLHDEEFSQKFKTDVFSD